MAKNSNQYSEKEAKERFLRSLKAAVNTPPKPLKDKPPVRPAKKSAAKKKRR